MQSSMVVYYQTMGKVSIIVKENCPNTFQKNMASCSKEKINYLKRKVLQQMNSNNQRKKPKKFKGKQKSLQINIRYDIFQSLIFPAIEIINALLQLTIIFAKFSYNYKLFKNSQTHNKEMIGPSRIVFEESSSEDEYEQQPNGQMNDQEERQNQMMDNNADCQDDNYLQSFKQLGIPVENFATLKGHTKTVSCVAVDPKGHRMATGGLDYHVRLWDFHGMNKNMNSFRIVQPFTGNAIRNLCFNTTGSHLMILNGGKQVTFLDRDGARNLLTVKGYMWVKEQKQTKGHTNTIYDGKFHPINANEFVTASGDGSIRLWDTEQKLEGIEKQLGHKNLIKCKDKRGMTTGITGIQYLKSGNMVFGGCMDGSLQGFSTKNNYHRPQMIVRQAHKPEDEFSCILSYPNSEKIITRHMDHTLKIWDLRMFTRPVLHYSDLPNYFPGSKLAMSPNGNYILAGTSVGREAEEKESYLHFFDSTTFQKVKTINMGEGSVTGIVWSEALNQIMVGNGAEGKIFFDEQVGSVRGALKCYNKQPRVDKDPKFDYSHPIYNPHSLPLYQEKKVNNKKKELLQVRRDPILSQKPYIPQQGPNKGGRQNNVAYTQIHHVIQTLNSNPEKVEDARKQLWELNNFTQQNQFFTQAYKDTQPQLVANQNPRETKQFEYLQTIKKICPHCGLKLCTCLKKDVYQSDDDDMEQQKK